MVIQDIRFAVCSVPPLLTVSSRHDKAVIGGIFKKYFQIAIDTVDIKNVSLVRVLGGLGEEVSEGNWTGCLGSILREETDVLLSPYFPNYNVAPYVQFSNSYFHFTHGVLSRPAMSTSEYRDTILSVIGVKTVILLSATLVVISATDAVLKKTLNCDQTPKQNLSAFAASILDFYGLLLNNGPRITPKMLFRRILVALWLIMLIVVTCALGVDLESRIAVKDVPERIDEMADILKYPNIKPYVFRTDSMHEYFKHTDDENMKMIWDRVIETKSLVPIYHLFNPRVRREVSEGRAVILSHKEVALTALTCLYCFYGNGRFYVSRENFEDQSAVVVFRRGLPKSTVELFNEGIERANAMGIFEYHRQKASLKAVQCLSDESGRSFVEVLKFGSFREALTILVVGLTASTLSFALEMLWFKGHGAGISLSNRHPAGRLFVMSDEVSQKRTIETIYKRIKVKMAQYLSKKEPL